MLLQGYLAEALKDKMKYLRNAKPRTTKKAKSEPEDMSGTDEEPQAKKPRKEFKQFPRSPAAPLIPSGEDKASHERHLKVLKLEERKVTPNKKIISDLMRRTYPFRRQEILEQPQPIQQVLEKYPSLKRSEQVRLYSCIFWPMLNYSYHLTRFWLSLTESWREML